MVCRRWIVIALATVAVSMGCTEGRATLRETHCAAGSVPIFGICRTLCKVDADCGDGYVCGGAERFCILVTGPPEIFTVDGNGIEDGAGGRTPHHIDSGLVVTGVHLSDVTASLTSALAAVPDFALTPVQVTRNSLELQLPAGLETGTYTLTVSNALGEDTATVSVLQGEPGVPGPKGDQGNVGPQGVPGAKGDTGDAGVCEPSDCSLGTEIGIATVSRLTGSVDDSSTVVTRVTGMAEESYAMAVDGFLVVVLVPSTHALHPSFTVPGNQQYAFGAVGALRGALDDVLGETQDDIVIVASRGDATAALLVDDGSGGTLLERLENFGADASLASIKPEETFFMVGRRGLAPGGAAMILSGDPFDMSVLLLDGDVFGGKVLPRRGSFVGGAIDTSAKTAPLQVTTDGDGATLLVDGGGIESDGTLGINATSGNAVAVGGDLAVAGALDVGLQYASCGTDSQCACPAGMVPIAGGALAPNGGSLTESRPAPPSGAGGPLVWRTACSGGACLAVTVLCARIAPPP